MGATTVAAALSDFQAISQTVGTLKGGTVGADNLDDEFSSDLESQEAVVDKPVTAIVIGAGARGRTYASYSEHYPNSLKIVGVADINTERKEYMKICIVSPMSTVSAIGKKYSMSLNLPMQLSSPHPITCIMSRL